MADHEPQSQTTVTTVTQLPPEKPLRKFPAPCWTQEETLALIESYRERWYALRRGYLRTADWDAVSASIAARCPAEGLPKTSAQCRHKMEKLRQRYRTEKQRSLSLNARFLSSWFFFQTMDSMENGPNKIAEDGIESAGVIRIKAAKDSGIVGIRAKSSYPNFDPRTTTHMYSSSYLYDKRESQNRGVKRKEGCPILEMALSIKLLGEDFVKMEKMKMEMARELEKTRMEMEMKRNELILDSQRQILDTLLTVVLETKRKKPKTEAGKVE